MIAWEDKFPINDWYVDTVSALQHMRIGLEVFLFHFVCSYAAIWNIQVSPCLSARTGRWTRPAATVTASAFRIRVPILSSFQKISSVSNAQPFVPQAAQPGGWT